MNRRTALFTTAAAVLVAGSATAQPVRVKAYKTPTCGCCSAWLDHLTRAGFDPAARDVDAAALRALKARAGIAPALASCHTAFVEDWVIEGHVPASDIRRLLAERPDALGLAVPGMPVGSPGMEMGGRREAFDTLLVRRDGTTDVFARHS